MNATAKPVYIDAELIAASTVSPASLLLGEPGAGKSTTGGRGE